MDEAILTKVEEAENESAELDFKAAFDPTAAQDWCELIKDIVAIANSGGGSILVGVGDNGNCCGPAASSELLALDPAVITDKIAKYTGTQSMRSSLGWQHVVAAKSEL